jgi:solute:Na+ symporter, SSS family
MEFNLDFVVFVAYILTVFAVGILASRKQKSEDYFLAGRNLTWWVIGGSLIAANISTHHFIGMAGQGFSIGLAIASYEWLAAITLILFGKFFLPYYLKSKIVTMPEFLAKRFNHKVRLSFAVISLIGYIFVELAVVLFTGALAIESLFGLPIYWGLAILCVISGTYTIYGGLKSVAYTDIVQVSLLIIGGLTVSFIGLHKIGIVLPEYSNNIFGGMRALYEDAPEKFKMVQTWNHPELPWLGVFFGGLWLANIFYWGCNQFITQRTLAARNIWHGQMGVVFAGYLKLLVPFLVVLPGIISFYLYNPETGISTSEYVMERADLAFPTLVKNLLPMGISGLVMAGLMGAVMSTIASLLTSSSSIIANDLYKPVFRPDANPDQLMKTGRIAILVILIISTIVGYFLTDITAIFTYIQRYWSIAYPSIATVFLAGFFYKKATAKGALYAILTGPLWAIMITILDSLGITPELSFLNRVIIDFIICAMIIWYFRDKSGILQPNSIIDRSFTNEMSLELKNIPWYFSFRFWSVLLVSIIILLYVFFF